MINFWKIDKFSVPYMLLYAYVRLVFRHLYYKQYRVLNEQNVPKRGEPMLIVCNHQNGLLDALAILFMFADWRQPVFIARGDLFRKTFVAKLLRAIKIMPAFRTMDGDDPRLNDHIFDVAASVLRNGHTIMMFPEAGHSDGYFISYFRKGFARVVFRAEEQSNFTLGVKILPVANHYSGYFNMREKLTMVIGQPVELKQFVPLYRENPERAQLELARHMKEKVVELMLNISSREEYHEYNFLRAMYERRFAQRKGWNPSHFPNLLRASKAIVARMEDVHTVRSEKLRSLLDSAREMMESIQKMRLRRWLFEQQPGYWGLVLRTMVLVLLSPLYVAVYLLNILPFNAPKLINKNVKDVMLHSSFAFGLCTLVTFPLTYLIYSLTLGYLTHSIWYAVICLLLMPVGLQIFYAYRKTRAKLRGAWRFYRLNKQNDAQMQRVQNLYKQVMQELETEVFATI
jgi:1-acyl-sn-glycerol-3-phosphate acyltransferase